MNHPRPRDPSSTIAPGQSAKPQTFSLTPQGNGREYDPHVGERARDPEIQELRRQLAEVSARQAAERFLTPEASGLATLAAADFAELIEKQ